MKTFDQISPQINMFLLFCAEREQAQQNIWSTLDLSDKNNYRVRDEIKFHHKYYVKSFKELQEFLAALQQEYEADNSLDNHLKAGI